MVYAAGLDFGTSGARLVVMDEAQRLLTEVRVEFAETDRSWDVTWLQALEALLRQVEPGVRSQLDAIAINGTSATVLLCDDHGQPVTAPLLYNDDCGQACISQVASVAPAGSPARSATSSLVKLLWWGAHLSAERQGRARYFLHQADWLAAHLHGHWGRSDYHNALKLGYDVGGLAYPDWLLQLLESEGGRQWLPQVQAPGTLFGLVSTAASDRYGISRDCIVIAGTTDSIAAFLASGAQAPGDAVTSLGSTLVIKLLSHTRVEDSRYGIYSHRLGDLWLVGGASNTGGAVLRQYFTDEELASLSQQIDSDRPSPLDYYPLPRPGERFPINDPQLLPRLSPRPADPTDFLQGLLEGMARIEAQGYERLIALGATPPTRIFTAGGGAQNPAWTQIRQRWLPAPVMTAGSTEAAIGTAKLALQGYAQAQATAAIEGST
ncbi:FGGY-family carbohydrate kinase [Leptolyngbya iicbica]|uniref:D-ribulose kinase n=2 Tax=Cyanophyceae TaxID=3028117 RepID=A0A4Q7EGD4_9CYAN|nr:FGGY-family carbohydrate kinase [Leptolyngbya sp. LK]RZM82332.1 carbohydrate kinase [Leptolyngbya sp. LK]